MIKHLKSLHNKNYKKKIILEKKLLLASALGFSSLAFSQVGVNTNVPQSTLDVVAKGGASDKDGLQAPRLTRAQLTSKGNTLYGDSQKGSLIYITDISGGDNAGPRANIDAVGYYYFDGSNWQKMSGGGSGAAVTAENGLNASANKVKLGGALTGPTVISGVNATNKLSVTADGVDAINFDSNTLSIDAANNSVGIGTDVPMKELDVNGELRIRDVQNSNSTRDISLVVAPDGVVRKKLSEVKGIFRAYLNSDFNINSNSASAIYKISDYNVISNPNADFDTSTSTFTAPVTGLYKITITVTTVASNNGGTATTNYVFGIAEASTTTWVARFALDKANGEAVGGTIGTAHTYVGLVNLIEGKKYFFGGTEGVKILANPNGATGQGLGSYFEIEVVDY